MSSDFEQKIIQGLAMTKKEPFLLKPRSASGVAKAIENFTQLDFGPIPELIDPTKWNQAMLFANALFEPTLRNELCGFIDPNTGGQYLPSYHLCLVKGNVAHDIHEVTHALSRNINPFHMRLVQLRFGFLKDFIKYFPPQIFEAQATQLVVQEGFAKWVETGITKDESYHEACANPKTRADTLRTMWELKENTIAQAKGAKIAPFEPNDSLRRYAPYVYGSYFVEEILKEMENLGESRDTSIIKLLRAPIYRLEDLIDPKVQAKDILSGQRELKEDTFNILEIISKLAFGH